MIRNIVRRYNRNVAPLLSMAAWIVLAGISIGSAQAGEGTANGEWRAYGADKAGTKYSPLDQIDQANFSNLKIAWRRPSVDGFLSKTTANGGEWWSSRDAVVERLEQETPNLYRDRNTPNYSSFQATPLMIGGVLYFNTPLSQGVAVDARTGKTLWVFNPKSYEEGTTTMTVTWRQRGVAYWTDGEKERIFWGTGGGDLICVNAENGHPCEDFGVHGRIDLTQRLPRADRSKRDYLNAMLYSVQSPPIVVGDVVIHGSSIADRRINKEAVPGWVRAWDVRTGEHKWDFHHSASGGRRGRGNLGERLLDVFRQCQRLDLYECRRGTRLRLPPDRHGDQRLLRWAPARRQSVCRKHRLRGRQNRQESLALSGRASRSVGLRLSDGPNLLDITVDGKPIKALAQVSKQGFVYAFDRVTGEPIWPLEERPVATDTNMPGEVPAPTQPFPTRPAPFEYQGVVEDDLADFTPQIRRMALEAVKGFRLGPLYTPQMLADENTKGLLFRPTGGGGANWSGAAVDPATGILYVPSINRAGVIAFYQPDGGTLDYTHGAPEAERLSGRAGRSAPSMAHGLPLLKPPYSRMTAIDMNTGEHVWMTPLGNGDRIRNHPMLRDLDLPPLGGDGRGNPLLTKTLLITALSAGGAAGGPRLVAYDKATGEELGAVDLPRGAIGTPMTYMLDGRQYIALTIGGSPPELIAFALPEESDAGGGSTLSRSTLGPRVFLRSCAACHSDKPGAVSGHGTAPPLIGEGFRSRWADSPTTDLLNTVRQTMPPAAPNSLSAEEYAAVTAYLLHLNK